MPFTIQTYGSARSGYDAKIRGIISQLKNFEGSLHTMRDVIAGDIAKIPRANVAVASNAYAVEISNEYTNSATLQIWRNGWSERRQENLRTIVAEIRPA